MKNAFYLNTANEQQRKKNSAYYSAGIYIINFKLTGK